MTRPDRHQETNMLDLAIRNGMIVDGSGEPGRIGDVSIRDGRIVAVGGTAGDAVRTIDAGGKIVAPGFIDPHTHYDAQLCFDPFAFPALEHGVTTVVPGNCSLSLAPLRADQRDAFSSMFRLIEEMPEAAFDAGVDWRWGEGFGAWLDALAGNIALNVAPLVGHSVIRMFVMGADAQQRAATPGEVEAMCSMLAECLDAGAIGMSTSFVDIDESYRPVPSRWAAPEELDALARVLGEHDAMLQIVHEFFDADLTVARVEQLADLSIAHGLTTTLSPLFHSSANHEATTKVMAAVAAARERGAVVWPQVQTRPIDISFTLDQRSLMLLTMPSWWRVASIRDRAEKLVAVAERRDELVEEMNSLARRPGGGTGAGAFVIRRTVHDRNADLIGRTIEEIAAERGCSHGDAVLDIAIDEDLGTWFIRESIGHNDSPVVGELLADPLVHVGASDGGAHVGSFSTFGDTGFLFSEFVRSTKSLSLEAAVKKITLDPATIWRIPDRGLLAPGMAADVVVFDADRIGRGPEVASEDFPGDGIRWIRRQEGIDSVIVNGEVSWTCTDGYVADARAGVVATR
ncbi:MAG: amidohydrolase family protein [Ilumatobacter sp.]|uniref:N-acyl-D-amino-acid deacylase family protein n=1 Tax=Ilumatobacter sp. TaxID=1967498 RepID=UPI00329A521C